MITMQHHCKVVLGLSLAGILILSAGCGAEEIDEGVEVTDEGVEVTDEEVEVTDEEVEVTDEEVEVTDEEVAFYDGEDLEIVIPFGPGGGSDAFGRFMAGYLERHLDGSPRVLPVNVPGGGTLVGFNEYARDHGDGYRIIMSINSTLFNYALEVDGVDYDISELRPVFAFPEGHVVYTSSATGYADIQEIVATENEVHYAATALTGGDILRLIGFEMLEVSPLQAVFGYDGSAPTRAAVLRGEADMTADSTTAYVAELQELADSGDIVPLVTLGLMLDGEIQRDPKLPDVQTFPEAYEEVHGEAPAGTAYRAYRALLPITNLNRIIWIHEDAPDEAYESLVQAFEDIVADPDFLEEASDIIGLDDTNLTMIGEDEIREELDRGLSEFENPEVQDYLEELIERYE